MKTYKGRLKHLYWKDVESGDLLRIEPVNVKFNILHTVKDGVEKGAWIQGFIQYDCYIKISKEDYESAINQ